MTGKQVHPNDDGARDDGEPWQIATRGWHGNGSGGRGGRGGGNGRGGWRETTRKTNQDNPNADDITILNAKVPSSKANTGKDDRKATVFPMDLENG